MSFKNIILPIISHLENNNREKCLSLIKTHQNEIQEYLFDNSNCEDIVREIKKVILSKHDDDFELVEEILNLPIFLKVSLDFHESDIMIKACKDENEEALHWLLTIFINPCVKDEKGMTALMHAATKPNLLFVVQYLIYNCNSCINLTDNNDETALFHSVNNIEAFKALLNSNIDINHINKDKETVLIYCCRKDIFEPVKYISYQSKLDSNVVNQEGKTAALYLVEKGRYHEFQLLTGGPIDLDYRSEKGETLLSTLIRCIYESEDDTKYIIPYIKILMILVQMDCDFNISIDEEGNTPLMFFIMIEDIYTVHYILSFHRSINVSQKNLRGETAFSLSLKLNNKSLIEILMNHPSFDFDYTDEIGNTLLMIYALVNNPETIKKILNRNSTLLNKANQKGENALMIATKIRNGDVVKTLLTYDKLNINQQDCLGNTALFYAVQLNIPGIVNDLAYAGADSLLKNQDGLSAYDLAQSNPTLSQILEHPKALTLPSSRSPKPIKKSKTHIFSFKKKPSKVQRSQSDYSIEFLNIKHCYDVIQLSLNKNENPYQPLKSSNALEELKKETYGYKDVVQPQTGVTKSVLYQALALEALTTILDITGNFF